MIKKLLLLIISLLLLIIFLLLLRINNKIIINYSSNINSSPVKINDSLLNDSIIISKIKSLANKTNPSPEDVELFNYLVSLIVNDSFINKTNPLINSSINASLILKSTPVISNDLLLVTHSYLINDPSTKAVISNRPYYFESYIYYSSNHSVRLIATSSDAVISCVNKTIIDSPTMALCIDCNQYPSNSYGCNECMNNRIIAEPIEYVNCFNNNLSVNYFEYDNYYFIVISDYDAGLILNSINMNIHSERQ